VELAWKLLDGDVAGAWDSVMAAASSATFFQTRAWAELLSRTFPGWRPDPVLIEFSDGNLMVLPMMRHRRTGYRECTLRIYTGVRCSSVRRQRPSRGGRRRSDLVSGRHGRREPLRPYRRDQPGLARWRLENDRDRPRARLRGVVEAVPRIAP